MYMCVHFWLMNYLNIWVINYLTFELNLWLFKHVGFKLLDIWSLKVVLVIDFYIQAKVGYPW